ncbi:unnamed protein product [Rhizopus stolonifer]
MTGVEAMDYTANDRSVLMLMNLTTLLEYKEVQAVPIALESEGEDLENRIKVVMDKVEQLKAAKLRADSSYNTYTNDLENTLYYLKINFFSAVKSTKMPGIAERSCQTWAKEIKQILNGIFMKRKRTW